MSAYANADYEKNIKKLYLLKFFKSLYFFSGILIPFFTLWGKISYFQIMILQSWFVFWEMFLEVPTGAIADKFGRKVSVSLGLFVNAIAVIIYVSYPSFYIFLIGEFIWALSIALISGADIALIYDSLKESGNENKSKEVLGKYTSYELWAILIATAIGGFIADRFGLQYATLAMVFPITIAFIISLGIKEPHFRKQKEKGYLEVMKEGIGYIIKHDTLKILAFDSVMINVLSFMVIWTYQPILGGLGVSIAIFGIVHSLGCLMEIIVMNNFTRMEQLLKSKRAYLFMSAFIVGISFILLSISANKYFTMILIILIFGFGFTRRIVFSSYMNKFIQSERRATVLSAVNMIDSLGRAIMYPLIGLIVAVSLGLSSLLLGIGVIIVLFISKIEEKMLVD